jgi:5'(3')-deoxyribonucleotidase
MQPTSTVRPLVIAVDVDDVTIDLCGALVERYNHEHAHTDRRELRLSHITAWELRECLEPDECEALYGYMGQAETYARAVPVTGALEAIAELRRQGHRVVFVTSCLNAESANAKAFTLHRYGLLETPHVNDRDFVVAHSKDMIRADLLVDDKPANVEQWGHRGIIFGRPHNAGYWHAAGYRAPHWPAVLELVAQYSHHIASKAAAAPDATHAPSDGSKPSNPKDMLGTNKLPLHLVPATAIAEESLAFLDGALKYGRANWRAVGVCATTYVAAAKRHLEAYLEGEDMPADSDATHIAHARACLGILTDAKYAGKLRDDRNVRGGYAEAVAALTPRVAAIRARYADRTPRHYTIADNPELEAQS